MASIIHTAAGLYSYNPYREVVSALVWGIAPRLVDVLTSKPTENTSKIDYIREKIFGIRTQFLKLTQTNKLTKYSWFILNDVIIANMGFATLFIPAIHLIDRTALNPASSRGFFMLKLLMCFPIAAWRADFAKKNKDWSRDVLPEEKAWVLAKEDFYDIERITKSTNSADFKRIPCILFDRTEFQKRKCAITNRPIREVVMIRESQTSPPVYYEYDTLVNWHAQEGNGSPPNWPESIPFHRQAIVIDRAETAQITEDLQKAISHDSVKNQARKHSPKLEKKLREELGKHIDSLKLPDQSSSLFKQVVKNRAIPQLIDTIRLIESTLGNISQERLGEIITAHVANRLMLLEIATADIKKLLINSDGNLALFNLKSLELPLPCYHLVLQIFKESEALERRIPLLDMLRSEEPCISSPKDEQLQKLESQFREAFYTRIAAEPPHISERAASLASSYIDYLRTHQNQEQENPDLLHLSSIPPFLHNDQVLKKHICPITLEPIRDPVQDPTTEPDETPIFYERTAIKNWLEIRGKSPVTQKELTVDRLIPQPGIKFVIDLRLDFHQRNIDTYLAESSALTQNLTRLNTRV